MKTADAIRHFGNVAKLADALGITPQAVYDWGEFLPRGRAFELQVLTEGALKVDGGRDRAAA